MKNNQTNETNIYTQPSCRAEASWWLAPEHFHFMLIQHFFDTFKETLANDRAKDKEHMANDTELVNAGEGQKIGRPVMERHRQGQL